MSQYFNWLDGEAGRMARLQRREHAKRSLDSFTEYDDIKMDMERLASYYMANTMGYSDAKIVDRIRRHDEALVLFDNNLCLALVRVGPYWEVTDETDKSDFDRNK